MFEYHKKCIYSYIPNIYRYVYVEIMYKYIEFLKFKKLNTPGIF